MRWTIIALAVFAASCGQTRSYTYRELDDLARRTEREQIERPAPDTCHLSEHQALIGTPGDAIDRSALPPGARVICFGCMATADYNAERLTIQLGADGNVASMRCG
ncbi:MAG: I78 family peptidase inhibitor [Hyphomonadaceae bacterium]